MEPPLRWHRCTAPPRQAREAMGGLETALRVVPKDPAADNLRANDGPNGGGGRDPGSSQFREVLDLLSLAEMGPLNRRFTCSKHSSQSRLDRFLCYVELLATFPLAEVSALHRTLSNHTPIICSAKMGAARPTYFKMDRSWLRDEKLKGDM